jgi:hypothetical protein
MERLPVLSGLIFYFAKFGLRRYVAVLTSDPWHETAAVTRGAWIHVGSLSLVSEAIGAAALGILGNAQRAAAGGTGLPGWGVLLGVLFASQLIMSILEAYGLLLYEDLRGAEMQAEDVKRKA